MFPASIIGVTRDAVLSGSINGMGQISEHGSGKDLPVKAFPPGTPGGCEP